MERPKDILSLASTNRTLRGLVRREAFVAEVLATRDEQKEQEVLYLQDLQKYCSSLDTPTDGLDLWYLSASDLKKLPKDIHQDMVEKRIDLGEHGCTLHRALVNRRPELALELIEAAKEHWPSYLETKTTVGFTPLLVAVTCGLVEIFHKLLDAGCLLSYDTDPPGGYMDDDLPFSIFRTLEVRIEPPFAL